MNHLKSLLMLGCVFFPVLPSFGGDKDWPQWRGPLRDGHAAPQKLLDSWPDGGPAVKWEFTGAGRGYSTVAVVDERIYTLGSDEATCYAICLDATNGSEVWRQEFSRASVTDDYNHGWGGGPRSTPTIVGEHLYVLSDVGVVACLDKADGKVNWKADLVKDYGGKIPVWGYSESPLIDGERIVLTPGESNFMIALDRHDGKKVWGSQGVDAPAQYVSTMRGRVGTTSFYVTASKPGMFAFDVETGEKLFDDVATGNNVAVIPTPILVGDFLYHTSDYGAGNTLLKLSSEGQGSVTAEPLYHLADKTMRNHHGGVVLVEGTIYGFTKANGGNWMAQDLETGETLWSQRIRPNRSGSICYADGHLYCYNDKDGSLFLAEASREGWNVKGSLKLPQQTSLPRDRGAIWAHPVIANETLIIRDQDLIFAYDIGAE